MRKARLILSASLLTIGTFSAVTFSSCSKDDKICNVGYEGEDCKTLSRTKFVGKWGGTELCTIGDDTYTIEIAAGSGSDLTLVYTNVYNDNYTATGTITGTNGFSFSGTAAGGVTFSGTATYENGTGRLVVVYKVMTGSVETNSCTFTGTKL
jgi:hypothetical protein